MIKRILKKTPIIIIGTVLLSIPINKIYAYTFNVDLLILEKIQIPVLHQVEIMEIIQIILIIGKLVVLLKVLLVVTQR